MKLPLTLIVGLLFAPAAAADEPPALNPFGKATAVREDAVPGYCELSDGSLHIGQVYLTRDTRLKIYDEKVERQREVPLSAVRRIDGIVQKEWLEKEWRFKENANDEKVYTGRSYPAREYVHEITLQDGRTIRGPLSAIVYVQAPGGGQAERFLLHKRDKGAVGGDLKSLIYVRSVELGDAAVAAANQKQKETKTGPRGVGQGAARDADPSARGSPPRKPPR
jgi:hypothetical protein